MTPHAGPPRELLDICRRWSETLAGLDDEGQRIAAIAAELPALLQNRPLFARILAALGKGAGFPDTRQGTLFDNEFVLHQDRGRRFSLRMYLFGPRKRTPVHDHGGWGVSGAALGQLEVARFRREDDGAVPGRARLTPAGRLVLPPPATELTLPLEQGIHWTGNPGGGTTLMVSVYGPPARRPYIQQYDPAAGLVRRVYPPRIKKKMLAAAALKEMEASRR
jgi:hypothetical protein